MASNGAEVAGSSHTGIRSLFVHSPSVKLPSFAVLKLPLLWFSSSRLVPSLHRGSFLCFLMFDCLWMSFLLHVLLGGDDRAGKASFLWLL